MAVFGSNMPSEDYDYFSVGSVLMLFFVQLAVLWGLSYLFIQHSRPSRQRIKMSNKTYGSFTVAELFTDKFLYWCPLYYHMKFAFLIWLQLPSIDGARVLYMNHLRPFLQKHQSRRDQFVNFFYGEMIKFLSNHDSEIQTARALLTKLLLSANHVVQEIIHPGRRALNGPAAEGPPQQVETSESESEDEE